MFSKYGSQANSNPLDDLAVVLDGQIVSAPAIEGAITGGSSQITYFPEAEAQNLANELNYGALPVTFKQQNIESVSPELGSNQLTAGLIAAGIGLGLVVVYSFLYYRGLGIVSVSSLIVAGILAYLSGGPAEQVRLVRVLAVAGRHRRPDRRDRHHRGLVRGVLRTAP